MECIFLEEEFSVPNAMSSPQFGLDTSSLPKYDGHEITRKLGTGAASTIYEVRDLATGEIKALKHVLRKDGEDKRKQKERKCYQRYGVIAAKRRECDVTDRAYGANTAFS